MRTDRDKLWADYYAAVRNGQKYEQERLLRLIQGQPARSTPAPGQPSSNRIAQGGGCSRCKKRFR